MSSLQLILYTVGVYIAIVIITLFMHLSFMQANIKLPTRPHCPIYVSILIYCKQQIALSKEHFETNLQGQLKQQLLFNY